jgi:Ftsk gamma domain
MGFDLLLAMWIAYHMTKNVAQDAAFKATGKLPPSYLREMKRLENKSNKRPLTNRREGRRFWVNAWEDAWESAGERRARGYAKRQARRQEMWEEQDEVEKVQREERRAERARDRAEDEAYTRNPTGRCQLCDSQVDPHQIDVRRSDDGRHVIEVCPSCAALIDSEPAQTGMATCQVCSTEVPATTLTSLPATDTGIGGVVQACMTCADRIITERRARATAPDPAPAAPATVPADTTSTAPTDTVPPQTATAPEDKGRCGICSAEAEPGELETIRLDGTDVPHVCRWCRSCVRCGSQPADGELWSAPGATTRQIAMCQPCYQLSHGSDPHDARLAEAIALVVNTQFGSPTMLARKLGIPHEQAERLMDRMEAIGIVGPRDGGKARDVLMHPEDLQAHIDNAQNAQGEPAADSTESPAPTDPTTDPAGQPAEPAEQEEPTTQPTPDPTPAPAAAEQPEQEEEQLAKVYRPVAWQTQPATTVQEDTAMSEAASLNQALTYTSQAANGASAGAAGAETAIAGMGAGGVTGPAIAEVTAAQEALNLAAQHFNNAHQILINHIQVQDAYNANQDAGTRAYVTQD